MSSNIRTNKSLRLQILFVILAFIAMALLSYVFMSSIVRAGLLRNVKSVLDVTESRLTASIRTVEETLDSVAYETRVMALAGSGAAELTAFFNDVSRFLSIGSSVSDRRLFYGYFENLPEGPVLLGESQKTFPDGFKPEEADWYQLAIAADGGTVQTTPYMTDAGEMRYTYAKCILDGEGRRLGTVCIDVVIDSIGQEVVRTALNQGGYGMLLNQRLMIMFHPNETYRGMEMNPNIPISIFTDDLLGGKEVSERPLMSFTDDKAVAFFRTLPNGWFLGLVTPENQYYSNMSSMAVVLLVLGMSLAAVLTVILIRMDTARAKSDDENKKKSMFLANMSHEIRTPINAIVGMTAIGRVAGSSERKDYCFSKIDNASKHLLGVVNDILDMSKIEANKIELSPTDFNFERMLQQAINVINFRVEEKRQKLSVFIDKNIPQFLYTDEQRFAQVITNLLSNAVKFTPEEGRISLKAALMGEEGNVYTIKVAVTDNGIGITPEQQAKLFQTFQQAESSTTRRYGGTGLGLAICKSVVELLGGEIWIDSEFGKGATFSFTIKAARGQEREFNLGYEGVNWGNIRILTVDDDPDILLYFKEIVTSLGATCEVARGAEEALRMVENNGNYNIYFIDLRMPGTDGIDLTKEIKTREKTPSNSVVIMISSAELRSVENDAKTAGVNKFLLKPLFPSAIADIITECIGIVNDKIEEEKSPEINGLFKGRRILFAEDIDINREIVLALLEPTQLQIECAENGMEAVKMFYEAPERYDMIYMDVQMPEMDGYEATRQIRALSVPRAQTVPIIAMTANVFKEDIDKCLAAGMNGHLGKPLGMNDLVETTIKYLGIKTFTKGTKPPMKLNTQ